MSKIILKYIKNLETRKDVKNNVENVKLNMQKVKSIINNIMSKMTKNNFEKQKIILEILKMSKIQRIAKTENVGIVEK